MANPVIEHIDVSVDLAYRRGEIPKAIHLSPYAYKKASGYLIDEKINGLPVYQLNAVGLVVKIETKVM